MRNKGRVEREREKEGDRRTHFFTLIEFPVALRGDVMFEMSLIALLFPAFLWGLSRVSQRTGRHGSRRVQLKGRRVDSVVVFSRGRLFSDVN